MNFNNPNNIVKDLTFNKKASTKIMKGVNKLAKAVSSTLGASGKCVIYEDTMGQPVITKDGVTVAESVVLMDPVENIGATLIKEAASKTVEEAGDGTTTATVLAHSILQSYNEYEGWETLRNIKNGIDYSKDKVIEYLEKIKKTAEREINKQFSRKMAFAN
jgi:chaperonin GroEL